MFSTWPPQNSAISQGFVDPGGPTFFIGCRNEARVPIGPIQGYGHHIDVHLSIFMPNNSQQNPNVNQENSQPKHNPSLITTKTNVILPRRAICSKINRTTTRSTIYRRQTLQRNIIQTIASICSHLPTKSNNKI